jgi:hypothetical protein
MSTVTPLKMRETTGAPLSTVLLGLVLLRGDEAIVFLKHVALLEGVVDRGLVVRAWFLQHVIEHTGASRGPSRALAGRVDNKGLIVVVIAPLCARVMTGLLALLSPLLFLHGLFGLAALRGRVVHPLALLPIENGPHRLLSGSEAGGDVE